MKRILPLLVATTISLSLFSQNVLRVNGSLVGGYKVPIGNINVGCQIKNRVDLLLGGGLDKHHGLRYGFGTRVTILEKNKLSSYVGGGYTFTTGKRVAFEDAGGSGMDVSFEIPKNELWSIDLGMQYDITSKGYNGKVPLKGNGIVGISYLGSVTNREVIQRTTASNPVKEGELNNFINGGVGIYVGLNFYLW